MREEVEHVINAFAEQAKRMLDHDRLSIYLLTPDGDGLERFAVATSPIVAGERDILALEQVGIARVIRRNEPILSADFGIDERIIGREDALIAAAGYRAIVSVPLRTGGRPFGLLNFVSKTAGYYCEDDVVVAQQMADQVAAFLLNLRLQHAMRMVAQREATELERNRVAREFHDTLAQALAQLAHKAEALAGAVTTLDVGLWGHATAVRDLAQRALDDVRRSLYDLVPAELEEAELADAIRSRLDDLAPEADPAEAVPVVRLEVDGDPSALPRDVQIATFRIFHQALANACQHARASAIDVHLACGSSLMLSVRDDGQELGEDSRADRPGSFGLRIMRERARAVGGDLAVNNVAGRGTEVRLTIQEVLGARPQRLAMTSLASSRQTEGQTMTAVTRVLVVDDHAMFREGLCDLLRNHDDIRVVGEAASGQQAVRAVARLHPDIVLLDLDLPDMTGVEVAAAIRTADKNAIVLMMSAFADERTVSAAVAAGAHGYISKSTGVEPLLRAMRTALQGVAVFSGVARPQTPQPGQTLTRRELDILTWLARGHTNAEIAHEFHLAVKTIERIVATIVIKLGVRNRTQAVARAVAERLIIVSSSDG